MFEEDFEGYDFSADEESNDGPGLYSAATVNFSGFTLNDGGAIITAVQRSCRNPILFELGDSPKDINNYWKKGKLILKKPDKPLIFIRNKRT